MTVKKASTKRASTVKADVKVEANVKPSKEAFMAAVALKADLDFINYGKLQKSTFRLAFDLAKELDEAYDEFSKES